MTPYVTIFSWMLTITSALVVASGFWVGFYLVSGWLVVMARFPLSLSLSHVGVPWIVFANEKKALKSLESSWSQSARNDVFCVRWDVKPYWLAKASQISQHVSRLKVDVNRWNVCCWQKNCPLFYCDIQGGPKKVSHYQVSSLNRIKNRH